MEAASPPALELLPDLPVEEPLDGTKAKAAAAVSAAPAASEASAKPAAPPPKDPEQTGLNFVDPEMFLAPGESAIPVLNPVADSKLPEPTVELELEDPVVDEMLTAPPPPPQAAAAPTVAAAQPAAPPEPSPGEAAAIREASRVPIARTASLSAAANKLAAAQRGPAKSSSAKSKPAPSVSAKPSPAPSGPAPSAAVPSAPARTAKDSPAATPSSASASKAAPTAAPSATPTAKLDAPSLASWASARTAAAAATKAAAVSSAAAPSRSSPARSATSTANAPSASAASSARPSSSPKPASGSASTASAAAHASSAPAPASSNTVPPAAPMDRDYIARNQVVERYLSGRLPLKGATEFERYCKEHPQLLDEIGLPERVNAGLRLLEASGKPEPWQETKTAAWQKPAVTLGLAVGVVVLGMALAAVSASNASKSHRIEQLQRQASERALDPATSTREIRLMPSRSGASNSAAITIGGGGSAQLADFKIDESRSPYHVFRITIDRIDQGRVGVINNLAKDSNGHLRIALNSSALGPGNYLLTLEGLDWRGDPQPDSWVTIGIAH
jgi:hypothetical protein